VVHHVGWQNLTHVQDGAGPSILMLHALPRLSMAVHPMCPHAAPCQEAGKPPVEGCQAPGVTHMGWPPPGSTLMCAAHRRVNALLQHISAGNMRAMRSVHRSRGYLQAGHSSDPMQVSA
jgi:hypothetical protein